MVIGRAADAAKQGLKPLARLAGIQVQEAGFVRRKVRVCYDVLVTRRSAMGMGLYEGMALFDWKM